MPRAPRVWFPGAIYHIIQRGNNLQNIFREDSDYRWFLKTVEEIKREMAFKVHLYVLMDNHYHMTIEATKNHISGIMHSINSIYAIRFNKKYQQGGHLFQGRFKGILVDKDSYLLELGRYIHLNPVKAGLVKKPEDYNWSSYRAYGYKKEDPLVDSELTLSQFRSVSQDENEGYKDFVNEKLLQIKGEKDWLKTHIKRQRFLGDKGFIEKVLKKAPDPFLGFEGKSA